MDAARPAPSTTAVYASVEGSTGRESSTLLRTTIRQIVSQDASHSQDASAEGSTGSESSTLLRTTIRQIKEKRIIRNDKRLIVGTRVSGPHGKPVKNPKGHGR